MLVGELVEQSDESFALVARDVVGVFVDGLDLDKVTPLSSVNLDEAEALEVDELAEISEESHAAEDRELPIHLLAADGAHRGDLRELDLGNVEQAADLEGLLGDYDFARYRHQHQRDQRNDERAEPRRDVAPLVEQHQHSCEQNDDEDVDHRPIERVTPVFIVENLHLVDSKMLRLLRYPRRW